MVADFDAARAELVDRSAVLGQRIAARDTTIAEMQSQQATELAEKAVIDARISGMDEARALLCGTDEPERKRVAVKDAVMALFDRNEGPWSETIIVAKTGLPQGSVHEFLVRATHRGKLTRVGDYYRLVPAPLPIEREAAE